MAITNYTELKSAVADWLNRSDLSAAIANFIALSETQTERNLRVRQMLTRADAIIDTKYSAVPSDFLQARTFKLTSTSPVQPLEFATDDQMDDLDASNTAPSRPLYFSMVGNQFRVHPAPDSSYTAELSYFAKIPRLSDAAPTNWLLTMAPDIYLYGALIQSAPYLKDDERINVWTTLYAAGLDALRVADQGATSSRGVLKSKVKPFGVR